MAHVQDLWEKTVAGRRVRTTRATAGRPATSTPTGTSAPAPFEACAHHQPDAQRRRIIQPVTGLPRPGHERRSAEENAGCRRVIDIGEGVYDRPLHNRAVV